MPGSDDTYRFGQFRVEASQRRLLCNGEPVPLTSKALDVLLTLIRHSGHLVTKQKLLDTVWPDVVVDECNLTFTVSILRKALGESGTGQRYIETFPKQGYRFIAPLQPLTPDRVPVETFGSVVERDQQLRALMQAFGRAQSGMPQVRFVCGEAGLGKTTLVRMFESTVQQTAPTAFAIGTCIDHHSQSEPYFPVFDALGKIARSESREVLLQYLRIHAPGWMARMPALRGETEPESGVQGQERMLRELEGLLIELARQTTVVLVLEDLQWCDSATVDVIARLARMPARSRFLLIGTWRPSDARARTNPIDALIREVCFRSPECLVPMPPLSAAAVEDLLSQRFDAEIARKAAPVLYGRTEGHPLFIDALLYDWSESGKVRQHDGQWQIDAAALTDALPASLRDFILEQIASLPRKEREVLEAASIARPQIWLRALAAALERPVAEVEESSSTLVRAGLMFRRAGVFEYPNGDLGEAFEFTHALYPEVIASALPPGRRVRLHQNLADFLEGAFGARAGSIAGSLAGHFRIARDPRRAIRYLLLAAERAAADGAPRQALLHLDEALELVPRLPDTAEREEAEMDIESLRGPMLIATDGFASCAAEACLRRALRIAAGRCSGREMPVAFGLAAVLEVRGDYQSSQHVLEAYLPDPSADSPYSAEWHHLLACSTFHQGQFAVALDHALRGLKAAPADGQSELLRPYGEHPRVECHTWAALALWFLGFPDQSLAHAEQAAVIVGTPRHGYAMANGTAQIAMIHQLRGEPEASLARAQAAVESGKKQGMPYRVAIGKAVAGWAHSHSGAEQEGVSEIREAVDMCDQIGAHLDRPYFLALLADVLLRYDRAEEAQAALSQALDQVRRSRSFFYEAELLRLHALVCVQRTSAAQAKDLFSEALRAATAQGANALKLRTLVTMVRLYRTDVALRTMLQNTRATFSEGLHLPDLQSASALSEYGGTNRS